MNHDPEVVKELAGLGYYTLCERLRGLYRIPVNDGCGPLNGSNEFVRQFETGPIQYEAAHRIESLLLQIDAARLAIENGDYAHALECLA